MTNEFLFSSAEVTVLVLPSFMPGMNYACLFVRKQKKIPLAWVWRCTLAIPALWRWKQEDCKIHGQPELHNEALSQKISKQGPGEMTRWLGALAALPEDPRSVPDTHVRQLTSPSNSSPGDLTASSAYQSTHKHTACKHTNADK